MCTVIYFLNDHGRDKEKGVKNKGRGLRAKVGFELFNLLSLWSSMYQLQRTELSSPSMMSNVERECISNLNFLNQS